MSKIKKKQINLSINILPTHEIFKINLIYPSTQIRDLRSESEISTGIPVNIQHLYYLDKCDLVDDTTVQSNEIVPNAILSMDVWHTWQDLVIAAAQGDIVKVFSLGVTENSDFSSPSSSILSEKNKVLWLQERGNMALMIAAHRGHLDLCKELIKKGCNVNWSTKSGRTPLHLAAARDKGDVINLLLHNGADIDLKDDHGFTAMTLANRYGHKSCERYLFMFRWQQRAKNMDFKYLNPPPMAFQLVDSFKKNWNTGPAAQFYIQKLLPPGEYIGSAFNAPKRTWHRRHSDPSLKSPATPDNVDDQNKNKKLVSFKQWAVQKRAQQKIQEEIAKKKEDAQRMIEEERHRQRLAKWNATHKVNENDIDFSIGQRERSNASLNSFVAPNIDTKTKIKELLLKFGLKDSDETPKTVYEQWLLYRKNMGKPSIESNSSVYDGNLPYQQMIKEFCDKRCLHDL